MIRAIGLSVVIYFASTIDLITILMLLYTQYGKHNRRSIFFGQLIGSLVLLILSLTFVLILHQIPAQQIIGLLGLVPLFFGITAFRQTKDESSQLNSQTKSRTSLNLITKIAIITVSSTGADNIGVFTTYLAGIPNKWLPTVIMTFLLCMIAIGIASYWLTYFPGLTTLFGRYGNWIMAVVYIVLGVTIIYRNHTIPYIWQLLNH